MAHRTSRALFAAALLVAPLALITGCSDEEGTKGPPQLRFQTGMEQHAEGGPPLRLLLPPYAPASRVLAHFQPVLSRLETALGRPVEARVARSYGNQIRRVARGRFDLAYLGPAQYIRVRTQKGSTGTEPKPLAVGKPVCAALVVPQESPLEKPAGLGQHSLAFGAPSSMSGHFAARVILDKAGLSLWKLADYQYLGRHERVARAVLYGDFHAGAMNCAVAERFIQREPGLRILAQMDAIAPPVWVGHSALSSGLRRRIKKALIGHREKDAFARVPSPLDFQPASSLDLDEARRIIRAVEGPLCRSCGD